MNKIERKKLESIIQHLEWYIKDINWYYKDEVKTFPKCLRPTYVDIADNVTLSLKLYVEDLKKLVK